MMIPGNIARDTAKDAYDQAWREAQPIIDDLYNTLKYISDKFKTNDTIYIILAETDIILAKYVNCVNRWKS